MSDRVPQQSLSWWKGMALRRRAYLLHLYCDLGLPFLRRQNSKFWQIHAPTAILPIPHQPDLNIRVFKPDTSNQTKCGENSIPIFVLIHGGGWIMGDAQMDDEQAHILATQHGFCVLSIEYPLAPRHRFPTAIHDLAATIQSKLDDNNFIQDLNLDKTKVVLGGFSAGAVMSLALAQLPVIHNRIKALVTFYPLTDWTREKNASPLVTPWGKVDPLQETIEIFRWAYIPAGQDLKDPLLSPYYATREDIPHPLFMITAEKDEVCKGGWLLARRMAGLGSDGTHDVTQPWTANGVRYECAKDMPHSFTHFWEAVKDEEWEKKRQQTNEKIWKSVGEWTKSILYPEL